ncbi:MAG: LD-carboxypeptidase [Deltaproteobacteria bacterium]|nr:LD-carboxypeptidase [Deltaproteobacteria bacterium]
MTIPVRRHLKKGDIVELVAPSSGVSADLMEKSQTTLRNWGLKPRLRRTSWNADGLYSGSDQERFEELWSAVDARDSQAIWCIRGGTGASRLLDKLSAQKPPHAQKLFIGFSDVTCLELFFADKWGWIPIHGPNLSQIANKSIDPVSVGILKDLLFGFSDQICLDDLNPICAVSDDELPYATIIGGNLSLVQASIGTFWQPGTSDRILFLEDVGLRPYQIVEKLDHLHHAGLLKQVMALVLGTFILPPEYAGEISLLEEALVDFTSRVRIPVFRTSQTGHGERNMPVLQGGRCQLFRKNTSWILSIREGVC